MLTVSQPSYFGIYTSLTASTVLYSYTGTFERHIGLFKCCYTSARSSLCDMSRPSQTNLANRLRQLSLNSPPQTALFYSRFFHALCPTENNHESAHIFALCLLETGEAYSALHVVRDKANSGCRGCAMVVARCSQKLGRFSEGQAVLARTLKEGYGSTGPLILPLASDIGVRS